MTIRRPKNPHVLVLSGACGSGKDYLAAEMVRRYPDRVVFFPSPTRDIYKHCGVKSEGEALRMSGTEARDFQYFVYDSFVSWARACVAQAEMNKKALFIIGKSPVEYLAYANTVLGRDVHEPVIRYQRTCRDVETLDNRRVVFGRLPWPTPWYEKTRDGFRKVDRTKDEAIAVEIESLWNRLNKGKPASARHQFEFESFDLDARIERIKEAFSFIDWNQGGTNSESNRTLFTCDPWLERAKTGQNTP